ncbi:MAG TPA: hypothetical protein VGN64_18240 [Dyadobacter sp.]|jgi:O-antigen/teichoic acid export membrane protein|nr:hypothetical protein [Dyadobacter sp.]
MSTTRRLISGTIASWAKIGVTLVTQIALVPIFLTHWNVKTYGIWIAIQALVTVISTFDRGFVDYLGYKCLQIGPSGRREIGSIMVSGIKTIILFGLLQLVPIILFSLSPYMPYFLGEVIDDQLINPDVGWALVFQWFAWTFFSNTTGLLFRGLNVFGYYPRMGWWDAFIAVITSLVSVLIVATGGDLFLVSSGTAISIAIVNICRYVDIKFLIQKEQIPIGLGNLNGGIASYLTSLRLSLRYFLENFRQQGVRIVLAPLAGAASLAAFSTIRTGANVTQQGLLTITNPLLPELMRFLNHKDGEKMEASFATVWLILVVILSPAVIILQTFAPPLFQIWTKGKIIYDPVLFAFLSFGVLVYALSQPALAIIVGNNMLKEQVAVSVVASIVLALCLFTLVPYWGITGAGIGLFLSETIAAIKLIKYAKLWLNKNSMQWPVGASVIATRSIAISILSILSIIALPGYQIIILIVSLVVSTWNIVQYWANLPKFAIARIKSVFMQIPLINKI